MYCRLCLTTCNAIKSLYDDNGQGNWLYKRVYEYFHPKIVDMDKAKHLTAICLKCFGHIYEFNNFQTSVIVAQMYDGHRKKLQGPEEDSLYTDDGSPSGESSQVEDPLGIKVEDEDDCWDGLHQAGSIEFNSEDRGTHQEAAVPSGWVVKVVSEDFLVNRDVKFNDGATRTQTPSTIAQTESPTPAFNSLSNERTSAEVNEHKIQTQTQLPSQTATANDVVTASKDSIGITPTIFTSIPANLTSETQRGSLIIRLVATDDKCRASTVDIPAAALGQDMRTPENPNETAVTADLDVKSEVTQISAAYWSDSDIRQEYSSDDDGVDDSFKCTFCGKTHESASALRGHTIMQHPDNHHMWSCHVCDKHFHLKKGLELHQTLVHKMIVKADNFSVTLCGLSEESSDPLGVQMNKQPPGPNQKYVCKLCNKYFNLEKGLELHNTWTHTSAAQNEFRNNGQRYDAAPVALGSVRNVLLPELKVKMDDSDNEFSSDDDVPLRKCQNDDHMSKQHSENLFKFPCQLCDKEFNLEKGLELHNTLVHKPAAGYQQLKNENGTAHTSHEPFSVRSEIFGDAHIAGRQVDHQKYACRLCNKVYNLKKGLALHRTLVHGVTPPDDGNQRKSQPIERRKRHRTGSTELDDCENPSKISKPYPTGLKMFSHPM